MLRKHDNINQERRKHFRYALGDDKFLPIRAAGNPGLTADCRVEDLSRGGCRVKGVLPGSPGDLVDLELEFAERPLFVTGRIVRVSHFPGHFSGHWAVEFITPAYAQCAVCDSKFASTFFMGGNEAATCPACRPLRPETGWQHLSAAGAGLFMWPMI